MNFIIIFFGFELWKAGDGSWWWMIEAQLCSTTEVGPIIYLDRWMGEKHDHLGVFNDWWSENDHFLFFWPVAAKVTVQING